MAGRQGGSSRSAALRVKDLRLFRFRVMRVSAGTSQAHRNANNPGHLALFSGVMHGATQAGSGLAIKLSPERRAAGNSPPEHRCLRDKTIVFYKRQ